MLAFAGVSVHWGWFRTLDRYVYDRLVTLASPRLDSRIIILGINEQSVDALGRWPWTRARQAELLEALHRANPAAVLVDIVYSGTTQPEEDARLVAAARRLPHFSLPLIFDSIAQNQPLVEVFPFSALLDETDLLGHVHVELDDDAIARGTFLYQGITGPRWPHLTLALAEALGEVNSSDFACGRVSAGEFTIRNERCGYYFVPFVGPPGSVPEASALALLNNELPPHVLSGKIVLVGLTATGVADWLTSPVSGESGPMSGVEYNANLLNGLLASALIHPAPQWVVWLVTLLLISIPAVLMPRTRPKTMLAITFGFAVLPLAVSAAALLLARVQLPLGAAFAASILMYPLWSWRRNEVAWRFIDAEMDRLDGERTHWEIIRAPANFSERLSRLAELVQARYEVVPAADPDRQRVLETDAVECVNADGQWVRITRSKPFSNNELTLFRRVSDGILSGARRPHSEVPGERLADRIRLLQEQAETVRLGRDIGMQGLEHMSNGVCVVSSFGEVLFVNSAFLDFIGVDGHSSGDFFRLVHGVATPLGQNWHDIARVVLIDAEAVSFEGRGADDRLLYVYCTRLDADLVEGDAWIVTLLDVTDIRTAQKRREETLAFLSHDLRSPILSILALVRGEARTELLEKVENYAQRSLSTSEQFLQLSRVQNQDRFEVYEVDLAAVVENAVDQVFALARDKDIDVHYDDGGLDPEAGWTIANGELLERAFVNLLTNAIKYSNDGAMVSVKLRRDGDDLLVAIRDQGIGIPEDEVERIFDPYFRSQAPHLAEKRGAGLGLRFVKTVIERHGGDISVSSRYGEGSEFSVRLVAFQLSDEGV